MNMRNSFGFCGSIAVLSLVGACTVNTTTEGGGTGGTSSGSGGQSSGGQGGDGGAGGSSGTGTGSGGLGSSGDGGVGTGGTAPGTGGASGVEGGSDGAVGAGGSDPCGQAEATANDDRDHATSFVLNSSFDGCLQSDTDVDFYQFTIPAKPAQGGFVVVKITDVGANGSLDAAAYSAADNGVILSEYGTDGASVFFWFDAKVSDTFRLEVKYKYTNSGTPTPYTLKIAYTGVPDENEPNDLRTQATPITAGTPVHGYLFAGFENSDKVADADWDDWFKVTLPAGTAKITLSDLASDVDGEVTLYDSLGSQIAQEYDATNGASVVLSQAVTAGDYYVKIRPRYAPSTSGSGATVPQYLTLPYTLTAAVN